MNRRVYLVLFVAFAGLTFWQTVIAWENWSAAARLRSTIEQGRARLSRLPLTQAAKTSKEPRPAPLESSDAASVEIDRDVRAFREQIAQVMRWFHVNPSQFIPEMHLLTEHDWIETLATSDLSHPDGMRKLAEELRLKSMQHFGQDILKPALKEYMAGHGGRLPEAIEELAPFLTDPDNVSALARYRVLFHGPAGTRGDQNTAIGLKPESIVDRGYGYGFSIGSSGVTIAIGPSDDPLLAQAEIEARAAYANDHGGDFPLEAAGLLPYFADPAQGQKALAEERQRLAAVAARQAVLANP